MKKERKKKKVKNLAFTEKKSNITFQNNVGCIFQFPSILLFDYNIYSINTNLFSQHPFRCYIIIVKGGD